MEAVLYVHDEPPPAWIADDAHVGRRIVRRRYDDEIVGADVWWGVAEVVRFCRTLTCTRPNAPIDRIGLAAKAIDEAARVARLLPPALPAVDTALPTGTEPLDDLLEWGPRTDAVNTVASALCAELDGSEWTCPDRLAGMVEDLRLSLLSFRQSLVRIAWAPVAAAV